MQMLLSLLTDSIDRYEDILTLMNSMVDQNSNKPINLLVETGTTILNIQYEISDIDEAIVKSLSSFDELPENNILKTQLTKWIDLQKRLIILNKIVIPKLESIQSLVANEHSLIKTGLSAIKGYHTPEFTNGKNINNKL